MNCVQSKSSGVKNNCINFYVVLIYFFIVMSFIFSFISLFINLYIIFSSSKEEDEIIIENIVIE